MRERKFADGPIEQDSRSALFVSAVISLGRVASFSFSTDENGELVFLVPKIGSSRSSLRRQDDCKICRADARGSV